MNCILRAVLLTQMTSDTSYGTCLHDILALILGAALYNVLCLVRNKLDQMLRTCSNTFSTCLTYFLVNLRNAVHDMNRIKRTSLYTAAVSKASVITGLRSAVRHECHGCTVLVAGILVIASCLLTGSRTLYKCYLALAFLGCPLRMVLRLGGGDLNALVGLIGFFIGILIGIACLKRGFTLKRSYEVSVSEGSVLPTVMAALLILVLTVPALFKASEAGPGSMHAPFWIALIVALVVGALAQKSRLCMVGGLRDAVMLGDFHLLYGFAAIFVVTLVGNLAMNRFNLGFALQPIAHSAHVWNLLGMVLVGWGSVLLGGCPLRQLILAAQGNGDSAVTVFGMIVGAALAHNFGLAGNPDSKNEAGQLVVGGISTAGKVAVIVGLVVLLVIAMWNMPKKETTK